MRNVLQVMCKTHRWLIEKPFPNNSAIVGIDMIFDKRIENRNVQFYNETGKGYLQLKEK